MIFKNRLMVGIVGFTLLQAAPTAPLGCSCQNKTKKTTSNKTATYKGNESYAKSYEHGKKAQTFMISDPTEYCRSMHDAGLMTVPYDPSDSFNAGFNDAYNKPSQY